MYVCACVCVCALACACFLGWVRVGVCLGLVNISLDTLACEDARALHGRTSTAEVMPVLAHVDGPKAAYMRPQSCTLEAPRLHT